MYKHRFDRITNTEVWKDFKACVSEIDSYIVWTLERMNEERGVWGEYNMTPYRILEELGHTREKHVMI